MQVKFFPIFFKEAVVLSPGATNLVMAVTPLALAGTSFFAQGVSVVLGTCQPETNVCGGPVCVSSYMRGTAGVGAAPHVACCSTFPLRH